ncbi:hypothetical protein ACWC09_52275 [Streptomyces sp. NPDC001617]
MLIVWKLGVGTQEKTQRSAINQPMALEQYGYTGRWKLANRQATNQALRMFNKLGMSSIDVKVASP